ncbi:hypothetical protein BGW38_002073, partial [Lunasporangiospora selenospora]
LYEAIGRPRVMDVESIPHFYERSDKIYTEDLQDFTDKKKCRYVAGEEPAMEDFLKRSYGLKSLELVAGNPYMFQWATPSLITQRIPRLLSVQLARQPLGSLRKLTLWSHRMHITLHAFNDAVAAFGRTLREICCRASPSILSDLRISLENAKILVGQMRLPRAKTVGVDWYLPKVQRIHIEIDLNQTVKFGSFGECPMLEELIIIQSRPDLGSYVLPRNLTYSEENEALMPVWKLPRLRILFLAGESMARFNFESLRSMKRLKDLTINTRFYGADTVFTRIYSKLYSLPLQQAYNSMKERSQARDEDVVSNSRLQDTCEPSELLPWSWESKSLVNLSLVGSPVMAFNLEILERLPELCRLNLETRDNDQYAFSTSKSEAMAKIYSLQRPDHQERDNIFSPPSERPISNQDVKSSLSMFLNEKGGQDITHIWGRPVGPLVNSRLEELCIISHWKYSTPKVLVYLLAWLAPNLKSLQLDPHSGNDIEERMMLFKFLQTIQVADKIVASRNILRTNVACSQGSALGILTRLDSLDLGPFDSRVESQGDISRRDISRGGLASESSLEQSNGCNTKSSEPARHPVKSGSEPKLPLAKVKINVVLEKHYLKQLGFREIEKGEAKICQKQGTRLYELKGRSFVEKSDLQNL